jgi:hypothetical protein
MIADTGRFSFPRRRGAEAPLYRALDAINFEALQTAKWPEFRAFALRMI